MTVQPSDQSLPKFDESAPGKSILDLFKHVATISKRLTKEETKTFLGWCQGKTFEEASKEANLDSKLTSAQLKTKVGNVVMFMLQTYSFADILAKIEETQRKEAAKAAADKYSNWEKNGRRGRRPGSSNRDKATLEAAKLQKTINATARQRIGLGKSKGPIPAELMEKYVDTRKLVADELAKNPPKVPVKNKAEKKIKLDPKGKLTLTA